MEEMAAALDIDAAEHRAKEAKCVREAINCRNKAQKLRAEIAQDALEERLDAAAGQVPSQADA